MGKEQKTESCAGLVVEVEAAVLLKFLLKLGLESEQGKEARR